MAGLLGVLGGGGGGWMDGPFDDGGSRTGLLVRGIGMLAYRLLHDVGQPGPVDAACQSLQKGRGFRRRQPDRQRHSAAVSASLRTPPPPVCGPPAGVTLLQAKDDWVPQ